MSGHAVLLGGGWDGRDRWDWVGNIGKGGWGGRKHKQL